MTTAENPAQSGSKPLNLRLAVYSLDALPAMPAIAQKLLALKMGSEEDEAHILALIEQDPQISAKILGLANSALIGAARNTINLSEAALLLGLARIRSISISIAIMSLMSKLPAGRLDMNRLWLHSFGVAFAMLAIARAMPLKTRPAEEHIFLAGMLHDIGYLALAVLDPKHSNKLQAHMAAEPEREVTDIERQILEIHHDELGAALAQHWHLPEPIVAVLRSHHAPLGAESAGAPLALMVHVAEKLLPAFGIDEYSGSEISAAEWQALGIDASAAEKIKEQVALQADQATLSVQLAGT
ncbi:MAG: HDOD domain-containing protein [Pseudomonadota bacterium]